MSTDDQPDLRYAGVSYEPPGDMIAGAEAVGAATTTVAVTNTPGERATEAAPIKPDEIERLQVETGQTGHTGPSDPATDGGAVSDTTSSDDSTSDDSTGESSTGDSSSGDVDNTDDAEDESSTARDLFEWAAVLIAAVGLALVFKAFLFQAFWIPSESMESTLQLQDRVLVNKVSYRLHDINRGDVVVFRRPDLDPNDDVKDLIKRVVAVEGEVVEGKDGAIYIDGDRLIESYLDDGVASTSFDFKPVTVAPGTIFVMGDNRDRSYDSRYFGTIPTSDVKGRAFVIFWPLDRLGGL